LFILFTCPTDLGSVSLFLFSCIFFLFLSYWSAIKVRGLLPTV
jgi:hypothetical protein